MKQRQHSDKSVYENIDNQMYTVAHVRTQGSTADVYMPQWASGRFAKPFLMFKRMAYQDTMNTINMYRNAIKNKTYSRESTCDTGKQETWKK